MMSDTSFKRKCVRSAFWCFVLGVLVLLTPFFIARAFGSSWEESFEEYPTGLLSDNLKWSEQSSNFYFVSDDENDVFGGGKAGKVETFGDEFPEIIFNPNQNVSDGVKGFVFNMKPRYWTSQSYGHLEFQFWAGELETAIILGLQNDREVSDKFDIYLCGNFFDCDTLEPIAYSCPKRIGEISKDIWTTFRLEGNFDNHIVKITNDEVEGEFCMWFNFQKEATTLTKIKLTAFKQETAFDDFEVEKICALGSCSNCETYDSCIGAGCFWEYSLYMCQIGQCYYCAEPYEPGPEQCDAFYKCQYCITQETCEAQLNCEWVDRGLGLKCYMKEPQMPPEQVEWEIPELEDCSLLLGVEKWLCEIKNFVAGIFMPSQDKIDTLYQTFANFKERFPFNYIGSMNFFFSDVRDSLDVEKNIPVKILGQEGDVNFSFWDKTTTIGGITEPLKNILKDFTSFIVFLGFFLWLISFIQRFF